MIWEHLQRQNQDLQRKLDDLFAISNLISIDRNFILGYIYQNVVKVLNQQQIKQCIEVAQMVVEANLSQLISQNNFLQFIVVLGHTFSAKQNLKMNSLMQFYLKTIESMIEDKNHLKNKYFLRNQPIIEQKIHQKIQNPQKSKMQEGFSEIQRKKSNIAQCPVCIVQIQHENICLLGCGHIIHKQCFQACMKESILNKKFPLKCPFEQCSIHIGTEDVQQYLPKELIEKYYEFTLHNFVQKNTKNMSWCPTPGCSNAFQFDLEILEFDCQKCHKKYCLGCKTEGHIGKTCQENKQSHNLSEQDKKFMQFAKGAKYKQCPECRFWVQKSKGCCHMTCRCGYEFCYVCGVEYGNCKCEESYQNYYGSDSEMSQINSISNDDIDQNEYAYQSDYYPQDDQMQIQVNQEDQIYD